LKEGVKESDRERWR